MAEIYSLMYFIIMCTLIQHEMRLCIIKTGYIANNKNLAIHITLAIHRTLILPKISGSYKVIPGTANYFLREEMY